MNIIKHLLSNVDQEKKERIINSALKEFSNNSYEKASTNVIVEDANVSKGILYHYFQNKATLYKYLKYFSIKVTADAIIEQLDWNQQDIFLRIKEISLIKFKVFQKYPYLAQFSLKAFQEMTPEEIIAIVKEIPSELYEQLYTYNIDFSLFKDGIDISKSLNIVRWTTEKFSDEYRKKIADGTMEFDFKQLEQELFEYIDMLKSCFYKGMAC